MSLEELRKKLEDENGKILNTKTILEKGISSYYIKKLEESNILEKKERGKYLVLIPQKAKENKVAIKNKKISQYKNNVRCYNFVKAYESLIEFYNLQTNEHSYEYIYINLVLLKQLLRNIKDFSILEDFSSEIKNYNLTYLSQFKISILNKNYNQALKDLYNIKKDGYSLDVRVLLILVKTVMKVNKIPVIEKFVDYSEIDFYYSHFQKELKDGNLKSAKELLEKCINLDIEEYIPYKNELFILVNGLINLQENKISFDDDRSFTYEGNYEQVLIKAIRNKDFKVAFSVIGACTYQTTNTSYLLMKDILYKMYNFKKKEKKVEPKEKVKTTLISSLYNCIMNKEFDEAQKLLTNSCEDERLKDYCLILFEELNYVQNDYKCYNEVVLDNDDIFKQVFEAVRRRDIIQAKKLLKEAIPLVNDKKEFQIYDKIIDEILYQNQISKKKFEFDRNLISFFNKGFYLSIDDVLTVQTILENRIDLVGENKRDYHLLNIIEVIISTRELSISKDDFSSIISEKETPLEQLNDYLQNGEFLLAEKLLSQKIDWKVFQKDYTIFDIKMIKYLLKTLISFLNRYNEKERVKRDLPEMSDNFYSLVKHRKYKKALEFYLEHEEVLYETEDKDIIKNLIVLFYIQSEEGLKLYEEYLNAKEQSNKDLERIALLNYKEYLKINNIEENYVPILKK